MADIYDQHKAAFATVSAFVILKSGERKATVAIKFPKDGAGRLYAYVHWLGLEMTRGHANGYGYDKRSAAVESAIAALLKRYQGDVREVDMDRIAFIKALQNCDGTEWVRKLEDVGFTVLQAV